MAETMRVAVLIDSDNVSATLAKEILAETAKHGPLIIKRAYGNWAGPLLAGWRAELSRHAIQPIQQFAAVAGKNATDTALIIDAMDLLYAGNVDVFCLVSSDSDFTRLAMRLRESGKRVYGIGGRKTPEAFTSACDRFTFTEVLQGKPLEPTTKKPTTDPVVETGVPRLQDVVYPAIEVSAREDGWAVLAQVGSYIVNNHPSFDSRNYGHPRLGPLMREMPGVEVKERPMGDGATQLWVRRAAR